MPDQKHPPSDYLLISSLPLLLLPSPIDTDPLDFEPTSEQFGITAISPETKVYCNFQGPEIVPLQEMPAVYTTTLHLSKLSGGQKSVHTFLAKAQNTRYAVLPIHIQTKSDMFFKEMGSGGAWFISLLSCHQVIIRDGVSSVWVLGKVGVIALVQVISQNAYTRPILFAEIYK
jgi:hypothetical protein